MNFILVGCCLVAAVSFSSDVCPYDNQVNTCVADLLSPVATVRAGAAESLGFLRAYEAEEELITALDDPSPLVRREAAMALAWCGGRSSVPPLLHALADADWVTRQAAWVSLTNLTGMEFPFDATAEPALRQQQADAWRHWWATVPDDSLPEEILAFFEHTESVKNLAEGCAATVSSKYKGGPATLTDGVTAPDFWQTKQAPFPQHCIVDLGTTQQVGGICIYQYGEGFCMTRGTIAVSVDGVTYTEVYRFEEKTPVNLAVGFTPCAARYVKVTSLDNENRTYPATFREIEVWRKAPPDGSQLLELERGMRAAGALGGESAGKLIAQALTPYIKNASPSDAEKPLVQAGLRSLGRLREQDTLPLLLAFLENTYWARYAADALGDFGGDETEAALLSVYPRYGRSLDGNAPEVYPPDDWPNLSPSDRMFETPYAIAAALARMELSSPKNLETLRELAPLLIANMPSDYDAAMLHDPEAYQLITAHLLEKVGLRQAAADAVFNALGAEEKNWDNAEHDDVENTIHALAVRLSKDGQYAVDKPYMEATNWLPAFCRDSKDIPVLIAFLEHDSGWVRINAAKALMFMNAREAIEPLFRLLSASAPEATYGYFGKHINYETVQGQDEYDDPVPRWREAFIRALGRLGATDSAPLLGTILNDARNAVGIQYAAALALMELDTPEARDLLLEIVHTHPYHSIRLVAQEALWRNGETVSTPESVKSGREYAAAESDTTDSSDRGSVAADLFHHRHRPHVSPGL